jgi:hypothetical protein
VTGTLAGKTWASTGAYSIVSPVDHCSDGSQRNRLIIYLSSSADSAFLSDPKNQCTLQPSTMNVVIPIWAIDANQPYHFTGTYAVDHGHGQPHVHRRVPGLDQGHVRRAAGHDSRDRRVWDRRRHRCGHLCQRAV